MRKLAIIGDRSRRPRAGGLLPVALRRAQALRRRVVVHLTPGPPQPRVSPAEAGIDPAGDRSGGCTTPARATRARWSSGAAATSCSRNTGAAPALDTPVEPRVHAGAGWRCAVGHGDERTPDPQSRRAGGQLHAGARPTIRTARITLRQLTGAAIAPRLSARRESTDSAGAGARSASRRSRTRQLVAERLWKPLGAGDLEFRRRRRATLAAAGLSRAGCCLRARHRRLDARRRAARQRRRVRGQPVHAAALRAPDAQARAQGFAARVLHACRRQFAAHDVAWLEATGKQRLWIVPSLQARDPAHRR